MRYANRFLVTSLAVAFLLASVGEAHAGRSLWARITKHVKKVGKRIGRTLRKTWRRVRKAARRIGQTVRKAARRVGQSVRKAVGKVVRTAQQTLQRVSAALRRLGGQVGDALQWLRDQAALVSALVGAAKKYSQLRDRLRRLRRKRPPVATGFDPRRALSRAGRTALGRKAGAYARMTRRHIVDHLLLKVIHIDAQTRKFAGTPGGLGDGSYHNGQYLAACAYRYGVTGSKRDRAALRSAMIGVYNLMTIASAPAGRIVDPRTGKALPGRPGLPVRGFIREGNPVFAGTKSFDLANPHIFRYEGKLSGISGERFLIKGDVSRDQVDGLMMGLTAVTEVLQKRPALPVWRRRLGQASASFARAFVKAGHKIVGLGGKVTTYGDQSRTIEPTTLIQNLSWLKTTAVLSRARDVKAAYDRLARKHLGGFLGRLKAGLFTAALEKILRPLIRKHREVLHYVVADFNYNLLMLPIHALFRFERDRRLRRVYRRYLDAVVRPLVADLRVPFFDFVYLRATGKRDRGILGRAAAVLRQYRNPPFPFGNPASRTEHVTDFRSRKELRDPLYHHLRDTWEKHLAARFKQLKQNPIRVGGGIWPLGPGLVPEDNNVERANPYKLIGEHAAAGSAGGRKLLREFAGHDYLLSYWYARYQKLL